MHVHNLTYNYLILSPLGDTGGLETKFSFATRLCVCHHPRFVPASLPVMTKFILVSGGVVSGIGKGVIGMRIQLHHRNLHV